MAIDALNSLFRTSNKNAYKTVVKLHERATYRLAVRKRDIAYSQISNKITQTTQRDFKKDDPNIAWLPMYQSLDSIVNDYIYQ